MADWFCRPRPQSCRRGLSTVPAVLFSRPLGLNRLFRPSGFVDHSVLIVIGQPVLLGAPTTIVSPRSIDRSGRSCLATARLNHDPPDHVWPRMVKQPLVNRSHRLVIDPDRLVVGSPVRLPSVRTSDPSAHRLDRIAAVLKPFSADRFLDRPVVTVRVIGP
ncbi:unnamed protein product [Microthlaspi erraticum]|uniref:Uncharacterized protein n=1 Tax=Microthlaspi erraticum TaxID=1685480 RepID=A0A6D2IVS3_9BRAS|nr:unnamed protein product [Microthlaspi erraticum]